MRKLLPLGLAMFGLAAGGWAGLQLQPTAEVDSSPAECPAPDTPVAPDKANVKAGKKPEKDKAHEYVKLSNQFVVPVVDAGRVAAMVVMSLNVEVEPGQTEAVYTREPRLRDTLLQVMFDHANTGGFAGAFTASSSLDPLRRALLEAAQDSIGPVVTDILIVEVARQDV